MYDSVFASAGCACRASRHRTIGTLPCPPPIRVLPAAVPLAPGVPPVLAARPVLAVPVVLHGLPAGVQAIVPPAGGKAPGMVAVFEATAEAAPATSRSCELDRAGGTETVTPGSAGSTSIQ